MEAYIRARNRQECQGSLFCFAVLQALVPFKLAMCSRQSVSRGGYMIKTQAFMMALLFILTCAPTENPLAASAPAQDAESLYRQAEELEWYKSNNMKEVDAIYDRAIAAGSDKSFMTRNMNRLSMAQGEPQATLAKEVCPKMKEIITKWQDGRPSSEERFYIGRYYSGEWCGQRDVKKSLENIRQAAEKGDIKAQYYLGKGLMRKKPKEAVKWLAKAAEAGFPQAIANQGVCYLLGLDVPKDKERGMALINKALASKNPNTLYDIAIWYLEGTAGLPKDQAKAKEILKGLAKKDYEPAIEALGTLNK